MAKPDRTYLAGPGSVFYQSERTPSGRPPPSLPIPFFRGSVDCTQILPLWESRVAFLLHYLCFLSLAFLLK